MSEDRPMPPCGVCGKPATSIVRDLIAGDPVDGFEVWIPAPLMRAGCDEHPVESREIR